MNYTVLYVYDSWRNILLKMHESRSCWDREEVCLPDGEKGVAMPGNVTEEEKYMKQKVAFVAYQV